LGSSVALQGVWWEGITIPRVISWLESENWVKHFCAEFTIRSGMAYWFANTFQLFSLCLYEYKMGSELAMKQRE
jgi:hypothetical protein